MMLEIPDGFDVTLIALVEQGSRSSFQVCGSPRGWAIIDSKGALAKREDSAQEALDVLKEDWSDD